MSRRSTPERLHAARRAATVARLISERELAERAEALVAEWEVIADAQGRERDGVYWQAGWTWIEFRRNRSPAAV